MPIIMLWLKTFHIVAVVAWFAALFYLPRLFVYHLQALKENDTVGGARFKVMEHRLYRRIMTPSVAVVFVLGFMLYGYNSTYYSLAAWMWIKLALAFSLLAYHIICGRYVRRFAADLPVPSERYFRWFNEYPVLVLVVVVLLVEFQPRLW